MSIFSLVQVSFFFFNYLIWFDLIILCKKSLLTKKKIKKKKPSLFFFSLSFDWLTNTCRIKLTSVQWWTFMGEGGALCFDFRSNKKIYNFVFQITKNIFLFVFFESFVYVTSTKICFYFCESKQQHKKALLSMNFLTFGLFLILFIFNLLFWIFTMVWLDIY